MCDGHGDGGQSWAHISPGQEQPGSILLPQKKRNKEMGGGATFDFAKMPKVCAKMHKTFKQSGWG